MRILLGRLIVRWRRFWTARAHPNGFGRIATKLAAWHTPPYHGRVFLSGFHPHGFVAPTAFVRHAKIRLGSHVYVGDNVVIWCEPEGSEIELKDWVQLYGDTFLQTAMGARIVIDSETHMQPGCHLHACLADIHIGKNVEIAARCAFYSFNHGVSPGTVIMGQPLETKGPIIIEDGAWLGHAVVVLSGVRVGTGAVIGAGSVVTRDVPADAIAVGSPARVIAFRDGRQLVGRAQTAL
jgi:acetyltransferase-like isoleucine patch superfamily enzyme